eukprot:Skav210356  [mRNA]  locus=scaffold1491:100297:105801:+ [translate_table: standard]
MHRLSTLSRVLASRTAGNHRILFLLDGKGEEDIRIQNLETDFSLESGVLLFVVKCGIKQHHLDLQRRLGVEPGTRHQMLSFALLRSANMPEKRKHEEIIQLDLVVATRDNTAKLGYFVDDTVVNPGLGIPFYKTVLEGANYEEADWKDRASAPLLATLLKLRRDSDPLAKGCAICASHCADLDEKHRKLPDPKRTKAYIIPAGMGLILRKGTWHDFPVSCGPPVSAFILNTEEVATALANRGQAKMSQAKLEAVESWGESTMPFDPFARQDEVLSLTNAFRKKEGQPPLQMHQVRTIQSSLPVRGGYMGLPWQSWAK